MINYGSFLMMRVVHITNDIKNKTLTIPSNVLTPLNADFTSKSGSAKQITLTHRIQCYIW